MSLLLTISRSRHILPDFPPVGLVADDAVGLPLLERTGSPPRVGRPTLSRRPIRSSRPGGVARSPSPLPSLYGRVVLSLDQIGGSLPTADGGPKDPMEDQDLNTLSRRPIRSSPPGSFSAIQSVTARIPRRRSRRTTIRCPVPCLAAIITPSRRVQPRRGRWRGRNIPFPSHPAGGGGSERVGVRRFGRPRTDLETLVA